MQVRRVDAAAYLIREGGRPTQCGLLLEGFAFRHKVTGNGARQILAICIPGDAIDLENIFLDVSDHSVQMLTRGVVGNIERGALQQLIVTRPHIARTIIEMTLVNASILREWVVNVGRRDSRARIAHFLCELVLRLNDIGAGVSGRFDFPITQEQLADATGLTPVHTNRTLQSLRKDGVIALGGKVLTVLDWDRLCEVGDFDDLYLYRPPLGAISRAVGAPRETLHRAA